MRSRIRSSSKRSAGLAFGLACVASGLALACAGELTGNEEDYFGTRSPQTGAGGNGGASNSGGGSSASGGGSATGCDRIAAIIDKNCKGCHSAEQKLGELDLTSPDVGARLVDQPSIDSSCATLKRVDSANPASSFLLDKVQNANPACGERMPYGASLSAEDIECVRAWVNQLAEGGGT